MALSGSALSALMRTAMLANPAIQAIDGPGLTAMCDALAGAVVAHLTTSGVVLPLLLVAPPGGGPVTGTGTIT